MPVDVILRSPVHAGTHLFSAKDFIKGAQSVTQLKLSALRYVPLAQDKQWELFKQFVQFAMEHAVGTVGIEDTISPPTG